MFTLEDLAEKVTGGNLRAMAKLLNDAGCKPRLDEVEPDPSAEVAREHVINLYAMRINDRVGRVLAGVLGATPPGIRR